jgi:hypothetical protein
MPESKVASSINSYRLIEHRDLKFGCMLISLATTGYCDGAYEDK